jgi:hypothetical protein
MNPISISLFPLVYGIGMCLYMSLGLFVLSLIEKSSRAAKAFRGGLVLGFSGGLLIIYIMAASQTGHWDLWHTVGR